MNIKKCLNLLKALSTKNNPVYAHYGITHRCNLDCRMCNVAPESGEIADELSINEIQKLANFLASLGIVYISIGGGEPLLREDICDVIKIFKNNGIEPRILTNGVFFDSNLIDRLAVAGLRHISLSLISLNPVVQNYICKASDLTQLIENIENFSRRISQKGRLLIINTMVSRLNLAELPVLVRFTQKMGYFISFIPLQDNCDEGLMFSNRDHCLIDEIYEHLIRLKKTRRSNIFNSARFLELSKIYLKTKKVLWKCDAGRLYFSINPRGEISICHKFAPFYSILNRVEKHRDKIINSSIYQIRKNCPGCMRPCWAEVSFYMRNWYCFWERFAQLSKLSLDGVIKN